MRSLHFRLVRGIILGALLIALGGVAGFRLGQGRQVPFLSQALEAFPQSARIVNAGMPSDKSNVDFQQFWEVWQRLEKDYVDPQKLDAEKMVYGAISGMVSALGDPYTVYLPPEDQKLSAQDLNGAFDGVGIQLGFKKDTLVVVAPLKGLPAERAGIQAGDYILRIVDEKKNINRETAGISLPEAVSLIRGERGSKVTLTMLREGGNPEEKILSRETIVIPTVELSMKELQGKRIAYISVNKFGDRTASEWSTAVDAVLAERSAVAGIVLDLRNNPGGYFDSAISLASEFISEGVVVTQQGKTEKIPYTVRGKARLKNMPVVVLVNKGSASASEILAGALRDRLKVKLVGENTFGKGTVQDAQDDLPNGAGLHITIAKWLLPSGNWIHEKGMVPDVEVRDNPETEQDEALNKALELL